MIERILKAQKDFYEDRKIMKEGNTLDFLKTSLAQEAQELRDTPPEYMDTQTYNEQELADVFLFAFAILDKLAEEVNEEPVETLNRIVLEKIARNHVKFPTVAFQNGTPFSESLAKCKTIWEQSKGNEEFYE